MRRECDAGAGIDSGGNVDLRCCKFNIRSEASWSRETYLFIAFTLYKGWQTRCFFRPSNFLMQKTRKSIAKRFKKTGTGKLLRRTPGHRHLLRNKSVKQRRRAGSSKLVADGQRANLIRGLPFA